MPTFLDMVKAAERGEGELLTRCLDLGLNPRERHQYTVSFYQQNIPSEKHRQQMDGFSTESSAWTAAAACGQLECLRVLVSRCGCVPDRAVVHAAACGHTECLRFLLESGGDAEAVDSDSDDGDSDDGDSDDGDSDDIDSTSSDVSDSSSSDDDELVNAFRMACASGRADCVRLLIAHGADWEDEHAKWLAEQRPEPQLECYRGDGGHDLVLSIFQEARFAWRQGGNERVRIAMGGQSAKPVMSWDPYGPKPDRNADFLKDPALQKKGSTCGCLFSMCMRSKVKMHH